MLEAFPFQVQLVRQGSTIFSLSLCLDLAVLPFALVRQSYDSEALTEYAQLYPGSLNKSLTLIEVFAPVILALEIL